MGYQSSLLVCKNKLDLKFIWATWVNRRLLELYASHWVCYSITSYPLIYVLHELTCYQTFSHFHHHPQAWRKIQKEHPCPLQWGGWLVQPGHPSLSRFLLFAATTCSFANTIRRNAQVEGRQAQGAVSWRKTEDDSILSQQWWVIGRGGGKEEQVIGQSDDWRGEKEENLCVQALSFICRRIL